MPVSTFSGNVELSLPIRPAAPDLKHARLSPIIKLRFFSNGFWNFLKFVFRSSNFCCNFFDAKNISTRMHWQVCHHMNFNPNQICKNIPSVIALEKISLRAIKTRFRSSQNRCLRCILALSTQYSEFQIYLTFSSWWTRIRVCFQKYFLIQLWCIVFTYNPNYLKSLQILTFKFEKFKPSHTRDYWCRP